MNKPEKLATLGTQDTIRTETKQKTQHNMCWTGSDRQSDGSMVQRFDSPTFRQSDSLTVRQSDTFSSSAVHNLIVPPFMLHPKSCVQLKYLKERIRSPVYGHDLSYLPSRYCRKSTTNYATSFWNALLNPSIKSKNVQRHLLWVARSLLGEQVKSSQFRLSTCL